MKNYYLVGFLLFGKIPVYAESKILSSGKECLISYINNHDSYYDISKNNEALLISTLKDKGFEFVTNDKSHFFLNVSKGTGVIRLTINSKIYGKRLPIVDKVVLRGKINRDNAGVRRKMLKALAEVPSCNDFIKNYEMLKQEYMADMAISFNVDPSRMDTTFMLSGTNEFRVKCSGRGTNWKKEFEYIGQPFKLNFIVESLLANENGGFCEVSLFNKDSLNSVVLGSFALETKGKKITHNYFSFNDILACGNLGSVSNYGCFTKKDIKLENPVIKVDLKPIK